MRGAFMVDVFVSYKSEDRGTVEEIVRALESHKLSVWWDQGIVPAAGWREQIDQTLNTARCVLVVWSRASSLAPANRWVVQEAEEALRLGSYVGVLVDEVRPPLGLRHEQAVDLIGWNGQRDDSLWQALSEVVHAKIERRPVDASKARPRAARTFAEIVRGRWLLISLLLALCVLIAATGLNFGVGAAVAVAGVAAGFYLVLDIFLARRKGERPAAALFRRVWQRPAAAASANLVLWPLALIMVFWSDVDSTLYGRFAVAVRDERLRPIPHATVQFDRWNGNATLLTDANGMVSISYLRMAPGGFNLFVSHQNQKVTLEHTRRVDGSMPDADVRLWSGQPVFKVAHWTAESLAIDTLIRGDMPAPISKAFPKIRGVLRNAVWDEASEYLAMFSDLSASDSSYFGTQIDGKQTHAASDTDNSDAAFRSKRWARAVELDVTLSNSSERGALLAHEKNGALSPKHYLILSGAERYSQNEPAGFGAATLNKLRSVLPPDSLDEDNKASLTIMKDLDGDALTKIAGDRRLSVSSGKYFGDVAPREYLRYLADRLGTNTRLLTGRLNVLGQSGCGSERDGEWIERMSIEGPTPKLRVSFIENITDQPIPIDSITYSVARFATAIEMSEQRATVKETVLSPLPGGILNPGEALIVPRQFMLEEPERDFLSLSEKLSGLARFDFLLTEREYGPDPELVEPIGGPKVHSFSVSTPRVYVEVESAQQQQQSVWLVGASVDSVSLTINKVSLDTREDTHRVLAILAGQEWGSCPFVFAKHEGQDSFRMHGTVLTNLVGASSEAMTRVALGRKVRSVQIRELEDEVSHINEVRLVVTARDGTITRYPALDPRLARRDSSYVVIKKNDALDLEFAYTHADEHDTVAVEVTGWYQPLAVPVTSRRLR